MELTEVDVVAEVEIEKEGKCRRPGKRAVSNQSTPTLSVGKWQRKRLYPTVETEVTSYFDLFESGIYVWLHCCFRIIGTVAQRWLSIWHNS